MAELHLQATCYMYVLRLQSVLLKLPIVGECIVGSDESEAGKGQRGLVPDSLVKPLAPSLRIRIYRQRTLENPP